MVSTVEWGATPPERQTWMDRLTAGAEAAPLEPPAPRFRPNYLALGLAVVGFLVALGSQYAPWIHLANDPTRSPDGGSAGPFDLHLASLPSSSAIVYGFSLVAALGLVGLLLFLETHRRLVAGAAIGVLAGNALALVGVSSSMELVTGEFNSPGAAQSGSMSIGFYLGIAALLLLVAAVVMVVVPRRSQRTREKVALEEPMELTVTGLGSDIG
jgi:hypothetical protein